MPCPTVALHTPSSSPVSLGCADPQCLLFVCPPPSLIYLLCLPNMPHPSHSSTSFIPFVPLLPYPTVLPQPRHSLLSPFPTPLQEAFPVLRHSPEHRVPPAMCWSGNRLVSMAAHIDYWGGKGLRRCCWRGSCGCQTRLGVWAQGSPVSTALRIGFHAQQGLLVDMEGVSSSPERTHWVGPHKPVKWSPVTWLRYPCSVHWALEACSAWDSTRIISSLRRRRWEAAPPPYFLAAFAGVGASAKKV